MDGELLNVALAAAPYPQYETGSAEMEAKNMVEWISGAADRCLPKRQQGNGRRPVPWWNNEIDDTRKECLKSRRTFQRKRSRLGEEGSRSYEQKWNESRKLLATKIKLAKEKCWADLIATVDGDPWGKPYKIVMKRLRRQRPIPGIQLPGRMDAITSAIFPAVPRPLRVTVSASDEESQEPFSIGELTAAAKSLPNGKAPGPDGIANEIVKAALAFDWSFSDFMEKWETRTAPEAWQASGQAHMPTRRLR